MLGKTRPLALTGVLPDRAAWRRFLSALMLSLGALLVAAGVIFVFAYNWDAMGSVAKFALAEGLLTAAVIAEAILTAIRSESLEVPGP